LISLAAKAEGTKEEPKAAPTPPTITFLSIVLLLIIS
jgi:hypothetical protein